MEFELYAGYKHLNQTPKKLGPAKLPARNFLNFHAGHHRVTNSCLLFQKWLKSVQDKWPKDHAVFLALPKNTIFVPFGVTPEAISSIFLCDTPPSFLTYILSFVQIGSGLEES